MSQEQYANLFELALNDATVMAHLRLRRRDNLSWGEMLYHLVLDLAREKEMYRKALIEEKSMSVKPMFFILPK